MCRINILTCLTKILIGISEKRKYAFILLAASYLISGKGIASGSDSGFGNFLDKALNAAEKYTDKKPPSSSNADNRNSTQTSQGQREQYYTNQYLYSPNTPYPAPYYQGQNTPYQGQFPQGYNQPPQTGNNTPNFNPYAQAPFGYTPPVPPQYNTYQGYGPQGYPQPPQIDNNQNFYPSYPDQGFGGYGQPSPPEYNAYPPQMPPGYTAFPNQPQCQCPPVVNPHGMNNAPTSQSYKSQGRSSPSYHSSRSKAKSSRYDHGSRDQTDRSGYGNYNQDDFDEDYMDDLDQ